MLPVPTEQVAKQAGGSSSHWPGINTSIRLSGPGALPGCLGIWGRKGFQQREAASQVRGSDSLLHILMFSLMTHANIPMLLQDQSGESRQNLLEREQVTAVTSTGSGFSHLSAAQPWPLPHAGCLVVGALNSHVLGGLRRSTSQTELTTVAITNCSTGMAPWVPAAPRPTMGAASSDENKPMHQEAGHAGI